VQLLGDFRLVYGDKPVTDVTTGRLQSLLAYLLLHYGTAQPRQHLAFLFWPDSTEAQARNNLRQALHQLRHALPDAEHFLYADTMTLSWRADSPFSLDVADFIHALATADKAADTADQAALRSALEQAASLYHGDLLPSCYDEWLLPEREQLHQQCQAALERLARLLEQQREYVTAIHYAQRLLRYDPLHEDTYLCLMRLHALNNDRAGALRVYHSCASILERELGVVPSPATHAAYTRLMSGDLLPAAPAALPTGTVTFLFTDIEGSTRLWQQHPYIMSEALARHEDILRQAIKRHHGVVFRTVGDAVCAAFAHAPDALNAALDAQRALHAEQWDMFTHAENPQSKIQNPISRLELRVRMALHTGVVETRAGDYVGHALNRLARILATGHGGQTLLSQATQEIVRDVLPPDVAIRTMGVHCLKDLTRPEPICQVVVPDLPADFPPLRSLGAQLGTLPAALARPPAVMVAPAPLIGRQPEWEQLQAAWQRAAGGESHFALVIGEAGIGKSRLADELFVWAGQQGCATVRTRAYAAEGRLSYGGVMEWLRSDPLRPVLARLDSIWLCEVARLLPELLAERPDLHPPTPLTEYWQRQRFFEAMARAVLQASQPLLLLIDDLQWCDQETLEWLHYLLRFDPRARLLVVGTVRAEEVSGQHPLTILLRDLQRATDVTEILLRPLDAAETAKLAANLAGQALGADQAIQLYRETEGNPLFVVETIRSGAKDWALGVGEASSSSNSHLPTPIPQRVHAVIAARLAQLSAPAHELAGLAATIGRAFTFEILARASDYDEDSLVRALDELWQRRIVREQGANAYDFSHDKIREVAYAEVSPMHHQLMHRRVARALETIYAGNSDSISGQVAAHYEQAGLQDQAVQYYQRAAEVAQRIYANEEAISLLTRGLVLLQRLPPGPERDARELALQTELGASLVEARGYGASEVIDAYQQALALCQRLGKPASPPILRGLALTYIVRAEFQQAHNLGDQILGLAERDQNLLLLVEAHYVLGVTLFWQGAFPSSREHLKLAIAGYNPQQSRTHTALYSQDPKVVCLSRLALNLWYLGYPNQAVQTSQAALAYAHELAHPFSLGYAGVMDTLIHRHRRAVPEIQARAEEVIALCREHRLGFWIQWATILHGWALAEQGLFEAGIAEIIQNMAAFRASGVEYARPYFLGLLAEQYQKTGDVQQSLAVLTEALATADARGERWCEAELHRIYGELLLLRGDEAAAEGAFLRALEIARSQEARSLELRAATSLARLWQTQGKPAAAHQMLADIYGWFSEGFETPDLRDARALLDQL
jgi:DNA-binding SARP family transcriptional activator/predicted ATPase